MLAPIHSLLWHRLGVTALLIGITFVALPASAATYTVTTVASSGAGSLPQAVLDVNANPDGPHIIEFAAAVTGTITLTNTLAITQSVTINGSGQIISGDNAVGVFHISNDAAVTLQNITIANGGGVEYGGAIHNDGATVTITRCKLIDNRSSSLGGAVKNVGTLTVTDSTFSGNHSELGGAIDNYSGTVTIKNSTFTANSATEGAAIYNDIGHTAVIINSTISNNAATTLGGAIANFGTANLIQVTLVENSVVSGNQAGGVFNGAAGRLTVNNSIVAGNVLSDGGIGPELTNTGTVILLGKNIFGILNNSGVDGVTLAVGNHLVLTGTLNTVVGALVNNGGLTLTRVPIIFGPAYNAGSNTVVPAELEYDQRGVARILDGAVDIGAVEIGGTTALNDTGITTCANETTNGLPCPVNNFPHQDGEYGRDAVTAAGILIKIGGGDAGFDFTKLDNHGQELPATATDHACVRDNVTGLMWEVKTNDDGLRDQNHTYSWYDANAHGGTTSGGNCYQTGRCDTEKFVQDVNSVGLCGFNDWRMPAVKELSSIAHHGRIDPAIDTGYFANTPNKEFWSGSPDAHDATSAWYVNFGNGYTYSYNRSETYHIRLVRGEQSFNALDVFIDNDDGTVTQNATGLMWAKCGIGQIETECTGNASSLTWSEALAAATNARVGGYSDWRLPSEKELYALLDYNRYEPAIDSNYFPNTANAEFWSGSPDTSSPGGAWYVDFTYGDVNHYLPMSSAHYVRLVRDAAMIKNYSITVITKPAGSGSINCTPNPIESGGTVNCTASANDGYQFTQFSGDCSGATCQLTNVTANKTVTGNFTAIPDTYSITAIAKPAGSGSINCTPNPVKSGGTVNCTATANTGYSFNQFSGDCTGATCQLENVTANKTVTGNFTAIPDTYSITAITKPAGSGSINCTPNPIESGGTVNCTASANDGYQFTQFSGDCSGATCQLENVTANKTVTGNFTAIPDTYSITAIAKPAGSGSINCTPNPVKSGGTVNCTATANTGYSFNQFSGDCTGATCQLENVTANKTVTGNFTAIPDTYSITAIAKPAGSGSINCTPNPIESGGTVNCTATANTGYSFNQFSGDCTGATCQLENVTANKTVTGNFAAIPDTYSITATAKPAGSGSINCTPNPVKSGGTVNCTATANDGYQFTQFSGDCAGTTCQLTNVTANKTVTGNFNAELPDYALIIKTTGSGSITSESGLNCVSNTGTCQANYIANTLIKLTATAANNAVFSGWSGACSGNKTTCTVTMTAAKDVTATFTTPTVTLTVIKPSGGVIRSDVPGIECGDNAPQCEADYPVNTPVVLTAYPAATAVLTAWEGVCFGHEPNCHLTLTANQHVGASFADRSLTVVVAGSGQISGYDGSNNCNETCTVVYSAATPVQLTATPAAGWEFIGWGGVCTGSDACAATIEMPTVITANFRERNSAYQLDNPTNGSFENGVSVVTGWACDANDIRIQVDSAVPIQTSYGAERTESQTVCGDTANGFIAVVNWAEYGSGVHTLKLLVDDAEQAYATVTTVNISETFLHGFSATTTVNDFPAAGLYTTLAWSEPHQNFVVTGGDVLNTSRATEQLNTTLNATQANTTPPSRYYWESPLANGFESGQSLLRGWACQVDSLSASIDDQPTFPLPYGSMRDDTLGVCGDTNNGYVLNLNWNTLGAGQHHITLYMNEQPIETRSFTVATPGGLHSVTGIQHTHVVQHFPYAGDELVLNWSEPHQNFRVSAYYPRAIERAALTWEVAEIYVAALGYAPDNEGLQYWVNNIETAGWTPTSVAQSFFDNPLVQKRYPTDRGDQALITALYQNIFNRDPDPAGYAYWLAELKAGRTQRHQLILAMINGGWANSYAASDMARFRHVIAVALQFAAAQQERGIIYSALSSVQQTQLRILGARVLEHVTADAATRDAAIHRIPGLLDKLQ